MMSITCEWSFASFMMRWTVVTSTDPCAANGAARLDIVPAQKTAAEKRNRRAVCGNIMRDSMCVVSFDRGNGIGGGPP